MAQYHVYILYSTLLAKYYTGSTSLSVEERLEYHLSSHQGFTAKAKDWRIVYTKHFKTVSQARLLENKIKKRGARRYLSDLR